MAELPAVRPVARAGGGRHLLPVGFERRIRERHIVQRLSGIWPGALRSSPWTDRLRYLVGSADSPAPRGRDVLLMSSGVNWPLPAS